VKRAIVIVLDGCGAGEAPDAALFGDQGSSTMKHVWEAVGGFHAPNLAACGFLTSCGIKDLGMLLPSDSPSEPVGPTTKLRSRYGRLRELSMGGKDSVTGHWEMMGIVTSLPFPTYPNGFPENLIRSLEVEIGTRTLGNKAASGTQIIAELGAEHVRTGFPIIYTSADSVLQIACHEQVVPLARLYDMCRTARHLFTPPNGVQRVIARPFEGSEKEGFKRTAGRQDFPLPPLENFCDKVGDIYGVGVVPELFDTRGFRQSRRTQCNAEHATALQDALASDARFIFANFEDFDMLYGHRNDAPGFARALEDFDVYLGSILMKLGPDDLLLLTADHGNDPTSASTDHSREYVPCSLTGRGIQPLSYGDVEGMSAIGATVANWIGVSWDKGVNLLSL
jgi:phosphopentomutase